MKVILFGGSGMGRAMISAVRNGCPRPLLESAGINPF
jgi:hypothetical protein